MNEQLSLRDIELALSRVEDSIIHTPLVQSHALSQQFGRTILLKLESLQKFATFKYRGVLHRLRSLDPKQLPKGIVTVSGGNLGITMAGVTQSLGISIKIAVPRTARAASVQYMRELGAEVFVEESIDAAFQRGRKIAAEGALWVGDLDDRMFVAGHGTVGLEMIRDRPDLTDIIVSVGSGALISGIATAVKAIKPSIRVWGVESVAAQTLTQALKADRPVRVEVSSIITPLGLPQTTDYLFTHVKRLVDGITLVADADAVAGVVELCDQSKVWAELSAGVTVPGLRKFESVLSEKSVVALVICGANATMAEIAHWRQQYSL